MNITVQTRYDHQYITMIISGYMNALTEPYFLVLRHYMEYLMHHLHELIMYSRKKNSKVDESPYQCLFKSGISDINKNKEYSYLLHTYFDTDHTRDHYCRCSINSKAHLFSSNAVDWCSKKQSETSIISSNA